MKNITNHQLKYFAWEITKQRSSSDDARIAQSLFDAQVDVNPHQIEAALFALSNPLSRGVVLADEVGLGKTIEAALVLCQYWAEYRRHLLIVCPASLRKQWALKPQLLEPMDEALLNHRSLVETVFGELKNLCQIEHSRHRSVTGFITNLLSGLIAYCWFPYKPTIKNMPQQGQVATL